MAGPCDVISPTGRTRRSTGAWRATHTWRATRRAGRPAR